jgi:tetratricopeptide repeat protein 30
MDQGMLTSLSTTLSHCPEDDYETTFALATLDFREGRNAKAMEKYKKARQMLGRQQPMLTYCIAFCHYRLSEYDASLELIDEIIDNSKDNDQDQCNSESFLVEALNMKAAVLYTTKNADAAKSSMTQLNGSIDTVTIHNDAIVNIEEDPSIGIHKLELLLSNHPYPRETLGNLLTMYTRHGQDHLAAEVFEANNSLAQELLPSDLYAYFNAAMMSLSCPDDAIVLLKTQTARHADNVRAAKKGISEATAVSIRSAMTKRPTKSARSSIDVEKKGNKALAVVSNKNDDLLKCFMPALCLQAKIYWDKREYSRAEQVLEDHADFCSGQDAWHINMGHVMFFQQKFDASIEHYELLIERHADLLKLPAVTLANLCIAYVLVGRNEDAEELIKAVEKDEDERAALGEGRVRVHSCIINLCIGSLYFQKKNYAFGIDRICKSMFPFKENICQDTWFYVKRSFLAFALMLANQSIPINDEFLKDIIGFFVEAETHGEHIMIASDSASATVASEGHQLKKIFMKICA